MVQATDNRRRFTRYPTTGTSAMVVCESQAYDALIYDESIGGLCLILNGHPRLSIGDRLEVQYHDTKGNAYVRSGQHVEGNKLRLGLSWDAPRPHEIPTTKPAEKAKISHPDLSLLNVRVPETEDYLIVEQVFYEHQELSVVCDVVGIADTGEVRVRLYDGAEFLADSRKISTLTRSQRLVEINVYRESLAALYGIEPTLEAILEYEFS